MNPNQELTFSCPVAEGEEGEDAGVRSGLMGHPFSRLIECLLSASSDLFYSPFLPLRYLRSSGFIFIPAPFLTLSPNSPLSGLSDSTLPSAYFLQLTLTLDINSHHMLFSKHV